MERFFANLTRLLWPILALVVLLGFNYFYSPGFFNVVLKDGRLYGSVIDIFERAAPVLMLAIGMTLVIATGGVDLSVGSVMAISGATAALLISKGHPAGVAISSAIGLGFVCGAINGVMVAALGLQPIVATLILMVAGRGVAQLLTDGQMIPFSDEAFEYIGSGYCYGLPFAIWLCLASAVIAVILLRGSALGLYFDAVGGNATASRLAGLPVGMTRFTAYAVSGICAAVAGLILTSDIKAADPNNTGMFLELDAILAVVLGGTALTGGRFTIIGSVIGAVLMQSLTTTILAQGVAVQLTMVVKALVILAVSLVQSPAMRAAVVQRMARRKAAAT